MRITTNKNCHFEKPPCGSVQFASGEMVVVAGETVVDNMSPLLEMHCNFSIACHPIWKLVTSNEIGSCFTQAQRVSVHLHLTINCLLRLNAPGQVNEQYLFVAEHAHTPYGNKGCSNSKHVVGPMVVVVDTGDVVDGGNVGRHLNPSRDSKPGSKSNLRNSVNHLGSILTHVQWFYFEFYSTKSYINQRQQIVISRFCYNLWVTILTKNIMAGFC